MNTVIAILLSLLIYSLYFFAIFSFTKELRAAISNIKNVFFKKLYIAGLFIPGLALLLLLKGEEFIYFWDYSAYWIKSIDFTTMYFENPFATLYHIYQSINYEEYNVLPNLLLAPANKLLGLSFGSYVFSIYLIYCLPFSLVLSSILIKLYPEADNKLRLLLPYLIIFFTPCLVPMRYGFVDIAGLVYIALVLSVFVRNNYFRDLNFKQTALTGILMLLLIFTRRWYAFWFVSFYFAAFLLNLVYSVKIKSIKTFKNSCINLFIAGIIPTVLMLALFYHFFEMSVLKDYSDIYSAYRMSPLYHQVEVAIAFFGSAVLLIALLSLLIAIKKQNPIISFLLISAVIIVTLFTRINDFGGYQHYYLLMPFIITGFVVTVIFLHKRNSILGFACFLLLLANNYFVFAYNSPGKNIPVFSQAEGKPMHRSDYKEIDKIANLISELQEQGKEVYCLASGGVLNEDIIKNIKLPEINHPIFKLIRTQHLDKRDRFPNELFLADYVITTTPVQLHLGEENQQIVAYFNKEMLGGELKDNYERVQEFQLKDDVTAILLRKKQGLTNKEINTIATHFKNAYPEYPDMYNINQLVLKTNSITKGDNTGTVHFEGNETLFFVPGISRASTISFGLDENDKRLSFIATFDNREAIAQNCNPDKDGEVYLTISENGILKEKIYITHKKDTAITLSVENTKNITLSVDKGKNEDYCDWFKLTNLKVSE